ncbi:hypothetical protein, variant [Aphanomyces astaci]|uniref:GOLD domain-containing protein n=1 Tax=Aphanomyces astaci TaxID=112090 RepID=W4H621_APHAT|nr:hypothetical protein, variant [Aphanomyces astaci]ETV87362.1 hypothetical protein, variant [Aphanomyces astaci]|eukprot:XP_009822225.1 hypothetical protein, variant [Aphanomyces astaci]
MRLPHVLVVVAVLVSMAHAQTGELPGQSKGATEVVVKATTTTLPVSTSTSTVATVAATTRETFAPDEYQHQDPNVPRYGETTKVQDDFNPYAGEEDAAKGMGVLGKEAPPLSDADVDDEDEKLSRFDFDPSEGLTFFIEPRETMCFYEDIKSLGDTVGGAYIVSTASSAIDVDIKDPYTNTVFQRYGDAEGTYEVHPDVTGLFEVCFTNNDHQAKLVTHVTNTLQSQHPVEKEHVSILAKYASHLDIRLGELESEQRLMQLRVDRHMKSTLS